MNKNQSEETIKRGTWPGRRSQCCNWQHVSISATISFNTGLSRDPHSLAASHHCSSTQTSPSEALHVAFTSIVSASSCLNCGWVVLWQMLSSRFFSRWKEKTWPRPWATPVLEGEFSKRGPCCRTKVLGETNMEPARGSLEGGARDRGRWTLL